MPHKSVIKKVKLTELISKEALDLLSANGSKLVQEIGIEVVRNVVFDVLTGKNLRDSTETLTRRRIASLNLAIARMFVKGASEIKDFISRLPYMASDILSEKRLSKSERWLAEWILGLTDKAFQNVLRDDTKRLNDYRDNYVKTCLEVIAKCQEDYGILKGELNLNSKHKAEIDWIFLLYLLNTVGSQTLAVRGSEKSAYGKLFEKLILGSLLEILGFRYIADRRITQKPERLFWLSSSADKRESDATLLYQLGKGIRFDIGFIGRGNPEISLDKVSRFEREISLGRSKWYMATIIIVDRIGANSRIETLAKEIGGTIIQMSMGYWPQLVAKELNKILGYKHELVNLPPQNIAEYIYTKLKQVQLEKFIGLSD